MHLIIPLETNQSGSFIVKSVSGGYTPEIHIGSRTGDNSTESNFKITSNREVEIRYQGSTKLATASGGVTVTGNVACDGVSLGDNEVIALGASTDLKLYHDSGNNYVGSPNNYKVLYSLQTIHHVGMILQWFWTYAAKRSCW